MNRPLADPASDPPAARGRQAGAALPAPTPRTLVLSLAAPAGILAAALVLPSFMLTTTRPFRGSGLGPAAWPNLILLLAAICAALWALRVVLDWRRGALEPSAADETEVYSYPKAAAGLGLILAYGWSLPWIGFPVATAAFIAVWCLLGGIRSPLAIVPLSLVGTGALLWVFMGLALMPLSRGAGVFDGISVAILRALGIY